MKKSLIIWMLYCITTILLPLLFFSCDKTEQTYPVQFKKGGNGNGHGNNGGTSTGCTTYTVTHGTPTDWNITFDTSGCGSIVIRWDDQPGFDPNNHTFGASGKYYIALTELDSQGNPVPQQYSCAGSAVTDNVFYYQYGWGCSMWPGNKTYSVYIEWLQTDTANCVNTWQRCIPENVVSGLYGIWNCN